jgi:hypothetical protein
MAGRKLFGVRTSTTSNGDNYGGWNKLNSQNGQGTNYNTYQSTSESTNQTALKIYAGTASPRGREAWIVGNTKLHGYSSITNPVPIFYQIPDVDDEPTVRSIISRIPAIMDAGNGGSAASSTLAAWRYVYEAGFFVWMQGGVAPIPGVSPYLAYDFQNNECYDGSSSTVYDLSGNGNNGTITSNIGRGQRGTGTNARVTAMRFDGSAWINVANTITTNTVTGVTYVWTGQRSSTNAQYVFDARNGGGNWFLTEYSGYDFNWGNRTSRFNNNNGYQAQHHGIATATQSTSAIYYNGSLGAAAVGNSGTNNATIGANLRIGTRYTNSSRWNMWMSNFVIYNSYINSDWADILWLHDQFRVNTTFIY